MPTKHYLTTKNEHGFTLVELLVVILIIGILAAVAIPAFLGQRQRANDAAVESDVKMIVTEIETMLISQPNAYYISDGKYDDDEGFVTTSDISGSLYLRLMAAPGQSDGSVYSEEIVLSDGVHINVAGHPDFSDGASPLGSDNYRIQGWHENGSQYTSPENSLRYFSSEGGFVD